MLIPSQFIGTWRGQVAPDSKRVTPYDAEIVLKVDGGTTVYKLMHWQSKGLTVGNLTMYGEKDGWLVLYEILDPGQGSPSWKEGTLSLRLLRDDRLDCNWEGKNGNANAIMYCVKPAATDSDLADNG